MQEPDANLEVGSGTHAEQTAGVLTGIERDLLDHPADMVLVPGDVNSTMGAALAATKLHVAVAHIESGLRSRDWEHARGGEPRGHRPDLRPSALHLAGRNREPGRRGDHRRRRPTGRQHDDRQPLPAARRSRSAGIAGEERARGAALRAGHPAPPGAGRRPGSARADDGGARRARRVPARDLPGPSADAGTAGGDGILRLRKGHAGRADGLHRLHRPRGRGPARGHRLGRGPGGDKRPRHSLPDLPDHHRAADHDRARHQRADRRRSQARSARPPSGCSAPIPRPNRRRSRSGTARRGRAPRRRSRDFSPKTDKRQERVWVARKGGACRAQAERWSCRRPNSGS